MHRTHAFILVAGLMALVARPCRGETPRPIFYLPLDGTTAAALAGGSPYPRVAGEEDAILTLAGTRPGRFQPGVAGQSCDVGEAPLIFGTAGNFRPDEGTCAFWLSPHYRGDDRDLYAAFFGAADWGMLYKYQNQASLTFGTAKPERELYYDCATRDFTAWKPDEWHHVAVTWSRQANARCIYVDGVPAAKGAFPYHRPVAYGPLFIGSGCTLYPGKTAHARMDEVAIWDRALDENALREIYALGKAGKPLCPPGEGRVAGDATARVNEVRPQAPPMPSGSPAAPPDGLRVSATRQVVPLDGWWHFRPMADATPDLPAEGWGWARVPGHWTSRDQAVGPDGKPLAGRWSGQPLSALRVAYCQRSFHAEPGWKGKPVFLRLEGVDGLADVLVNGRRIGRLPAWEEEAYEVGPLLRYDRENTVTIALWSVGNSRVAGIYGSVSLQVMPRAFIKDVVVQPLVEKGQIRFSCDVWDGGQPVPAQLELLVSPAAEPSKVERFAYPVRLSSALRSSGKGDLSSQTQRVECLFPWKGARPWTYDDPFLYQVRARLMLGGTAVDQAPPVRFGYREFTVRGSELLLNGKPTHLRGHQIDLAWGNQMARVKELKSAGMNCFEFSGPVSHNWYAGVPCRPREFEEILEYADEHGLLAIPNLPDAIALQERVFDPEVAALYRRRLEKHTRRYGNHPAIGLWFMHFNLSGYHWYVAPDKVDGSYKPSDATARAKERYAVEAERIAHTVDPRPIYHHACGNFGSIFTNNCYIGPTAPLQEREEWPSRWAEKRPFPLIAAEHCLMLIPYWFRERKFPLSDVYASEPLFDEISAITLGRRAYAALTPGLFERYDVGRKPGGSRTRALIEAHPGYQEVKSVYAPRSLRSWRTYGVSGIIFNAENWDFWDAAGSPSPVYKAFGRYFGDTDLYIAGPAGDWPSKDHAFLTGERIRKQVVLLNDLTRDTPVALTWRLEGSDGKVHASGKLESTARAGQPTFLPFDAAAPDVAERTRYQLVVEPAQSAAGKTNPRGLKGAQRGSGGASQGATASPAAAPTARPKSVATQGGADSGSPLSPSEPSAVSSSGSFRPEAFAVEVFPRPARPEVGGRVLLFDANGKTGPALQRLGIPFEALDEKSDLAGAALVIVGRESYGDAFCALAGKLGLERAVREGLNLLVLEQTAGTPCGLKLQERSTRQAFIAAPGHPFLAGLEEGDLHDLRGESDLMPAYPPAPPETEREWPERFWKWGNHGVLSTYVLRKPHYAPFVPVLECGFDLTDSPLMEARIGAGRVALCQVDVTSRLGTDPVASRLTLNLVRELSRRGRGMAPVWAGVGDSARAFLAPFGIVPEAFDAERSRLVAVGSEALSPEQLRGLEAAAQRGATLLLLPGAAPAFGLPLKEERLFIGRTGTQPLLAGLSDADLYLKEWKSLRVAQATDGWECLAQPGLLMAKTAGAGRLVACQLDPGALGASRGRVKALRFWSTLLANLGGRRAGFESFLGPATRLYEGNSWEEIPPYMNW